MKSGRTFVLLSIILITFFLLLQLNYCNASDKFFPQQLLNKPRNQTPVSDKNVKLAEVVYNFSGKEVRGLIAYPAKSNNPVFPGVLFIQTNDESPRDQMGRINLLALNGYLVMCVPWKNSDDIEEAFNQMLRINKVDNSRVGLVGAQQGAAEAVILAVKKRNMVKSVVSIAGRPDYNHPSGDPGALLQAPILIIHGEVDTQVACNVAQYFYYYLNDKGKQAEIILLPNSRHYFNDAEWNMIITDVNRFLDKNLKNPPQKK
jgi:dienelactone hydrolase